MTDPIRVNSGFTIFSPQIGHFGEHTAVIGGRPLMVVLVLLGLGGIGVGMLGLAVHQGWGTAGSLSPTDGAIMAGVGGGAGFISFVLGCMGYFKENQYVGYRLVLKKTLLNELLANSNHTFVLQENKKYSLVLRVADEFKVLESDLEASQVDPIDFQDKIDFLAKHELSVTNERRVMLTTNELDTLKRAFGEYGERSPLKPRILQIVESEAFKQDTFGYFAPHRDKLQTYENGDDDQRAIYHIAGHGIIKRLLRLN